MDSLWATTLLRQLLRNASESTPGDGARPGSQATTWQTTITHQKTGSSRPAETASLLTADASDHLAASGATTADQPPRESSSQVPPARPPATPAAACALPPLSVDTTSRAAQHAKCAQGPCCCATSCDDSTQHSTQHDAEPGGDGGGDVGGEDVHGLRLEMLFPTDAAKVDIRARDIFLAEEEEAKEMVVAFMNETNLLLPPVVTFRGVDGAVTIYRLAAFTGTRFFRSCAIHHTSDGHPGNPVSRPAPADTRRRSSSSTGSHSGGLGRASPKSRELPQPPLLPQMREVDVHECEPATLGCLLQMVESRAVPAITLRQATQLFAAAQYCLAERLQELLFDYLAPMVQELSAKEVVWLVAGVLRACSRPEDPLCCADRILLLATCCPAFTAAPGDTHAAPAEPPRSRHAPSTWPASSTSPTPRPPRDDRTPPAAPSTPQPPAPRPASAPPSARSARDTAAGSAADPACTSLELAQFAQSLFSPLDERFTDALLLLCSCAEVPGWMRAACLVSACMSVRSSPPCDDVVMRAMIAAEHVLFSLRDPAARFAPMHASRHAALIQQLLSDACMQPLHPPQSEMISAIVLHIAMHVAAVGQRRPQTLCMRQLLAADPANPDLFSIPLGRTGRALLMCKVVIPRGSNHVKSKVLHGWSLNIKETPEAEVSKRPGAWLPVSLFLQNHLPMTRKASVIVGLSPAPPDPSGEGGSEARAEEHEEFMRALQERCAAEELLEVEAPLTWPVLMEALQEVMFEEPHVCWGYSTLRVPPEQQRLVKRCCQAASMQDWGGRVAYAFACVQNIP